MKKYMLIGFRNKDNFNPSKELTQEARQELVNRWRTWQEELGDLIIDMGSPLMNGVSIDSNGDTGKKVSAIGGYMKIQANDFNHAMELLNKSPLFDNGHAQDYEIFESFM